LNYKLYNNKIIQNNDSNKKINIHSFDFLKIYYFILILIFLFLIIYFFKFIKKKKY
jgi:hypothetical protein